MGYKKRLLGEMEESISLAEMMKEVISNLPDDLPGEISLTMTSCSAWITIDVGNKVEKAKARRMFGENITPRTPASTYHKAGLVLQAYEFKDYPWPTIGLHIDIEPDEQSCRRVQVGTIAQPVYKVVCNDEEND